ncbi:hypothetical protein GCM10020331_056970 [Ectobacillus funiculus]
METISVHNASLFTGGRKTPISISSSRNAWICAGVAISKKDVLGHPGTNCEILAEQQGEYRR